MTLALQIPSKKNYTTWRE